MKVCFNKNVDLKIVVFSRMVFDPLKLYWFHPLCLPSLKYIGMKHEISMCQALLK